IALAGYVLLTTLAPISTGPHCARHVEIVLVGAVRHRRPTRAAIPRRLYQHRALPVGLENTPGFIIIRQLVGALWHRRVANRVGLRLGRLLPRLLGYWELFDAN